MDDEDGGHEMLAERRPFEELSSVVRPPLSHHFIRPLSLSLSLRSRVSQRRARRTLVAASDYGMRVINLLPRYYML